MTSLPVSENLNDLPRAPGPRGEAGTTARFSPNPLESLPQLQRAYGDVVDFGGETPSYLLSDPALIEFVHVQTGRLFDKGYTGSDAAMQPLFGNGLVVSEGDFWLRQRRMVQPAFHRDRIQGYGQVMVEYAERLTRGWQDGEARDAHADMMHVTLEIILKTLFGAQADDRAHAFGQAMDEMLGSLAELYRATPESGPDIQARYLDALERIDTFVAGVIAERRQGRGQGAGQDQANPDQVNPDRGDLLSMLLLAQDDEQRGMTEQQLLDEAKNLILAGHETTSNTLSWTWLLLARYPEVEARLHAELDAVLTGGRAPTVEDLPQLNYTRMVISEAMRILPPVWSVGRRARQDMNLGGYFIPAGAMLSMSQWVVQRDERWFPQPLEFRPERWADGLEKTLPKYAYFPFGGGPRVCIGENFARMEAVLLLASIARRFRVLVQRPDDTELEPSVTLRPRRGLPVVLEARR